MPRIKDQALCIRLIDWSETSQVVALFSEQHGKFRGLAKGSKRTSPGITERFSGGIELLTAGQVVATIKPQALATITEWDLQRPHWHLRRNLATHRLGMYLADLLGALYEDQDPHPASYAAALRFLDALAEPADHQAALLQLHWELLTDAGYAPSVAQDAVAGDALPPQDAYTFDPRQGGLTAAAAPTTGESDRGPWRVRRQTVEWLQRAAAEDWPSLADAPPPALERANRLLCVYLRALLDRELPTMRYILV